MTISDESNGELTEGKFESTDEPSQETIDTSRKGLVFTVTSPTGGSGKSSVALLLGTALAKASQKSAESGLSERPLDVVVVDLDIFDGQLGFLMGQRMPTVLDIFLSDSSQDPATIKSNLAYSSGMGIHALLAPVKSESAPYLTAAFYRDIILRLKTMFDVVILDTSVHRYDDLIRMVALPEADAILLTTTLNGGSVAAMTRWIDVVTTPRLDGSGYPRIDMRNVAIVVNGSVKGVGVGGEELVSAAQGVPLLVAIPLDTIAVQNAANSNRLEDLLLHPTIGPAYFKLANKMVKSRGIGLRLLPIIEDEANEMIIATEFNTELTEVEPNPTDKCLPENIDTSHNALVITVTSPTGGSGKSSAALLLGTTLAKASQKAFEAGLSERPLDVVVVDLDTFDGHLGFIVGQMAPTALNIAMSAKPSDPATIKSNLVYNSRMGIHALLAPVRGQTAVYTNPSFYRKTIRALKTMFDIVILDTSVQYHNDLIKTVALPEADAILLVTTLSIGSVNGISRWIETASAPVSNGGLGIDLSKLGVVVNQAVQGIGTGSQALVSATQGVPLLVAIPLDTRSVQAAGNANRLEDITLHPTIGPAYFKLANKIAVSHGIGFKLLPLIDDKNIQ